MAGNNWLLAIDFGSSNTAAAHTVDGRIEALRLSADGALMPSPVYVDAPDRIAVGAFAANEAQRAPAGYLPSPKRHAGQSVIAINGHTIPAAAPIAQVIGTVLRTATAAHHGQPPTQVVLTHPEAWAPPQTQTLLDAARLAGIDPATIVTVSEPRAAVFHYADHHTLTPGVHVAVFDFGGGTLDVSVLRLSSAAADSAQPIEVGVVAARGDNGIGGRDIDTAIRQWVDAQLATSNPRFLEFLTNSASAHVRRDLDLSIQHAKELLSEAPSVTIALSDGAGFTDSLTLSREEFGRIIAPVLARAAELTRRTLLDAGLTGPDQLGALYLTGGSSRIPAVQRRLGEFGPVATLDDPKTVVATGALAFARAAQNVPASNAATNARFTHPGIQPPAPSPAQSVVDQAVAQSVPEVFSDIGGRRYTRWLIVGALIAVLVLGLGITAFALRGGGESSDSGASTPSVDAGPSTPLVQTSQTTDDVLDSLPQALRDQVDHINNSEQAEKFLREFGLITE